MVTDLKSRGRDRILEPTPLYMRICLYVYITGVWVLGPFTEGIVSLALRCNACLLVHSIRAFRSKQA